VQEPEREPGEKIQEKRMSFAEFLDVVVEKSFRNSSFAMYVMREFILPGKTDDLQEILFGVR
jgi:hypothetical protein